MNKRFRIRFLSVFLGLILALSAPLCAYAQEDSSFSVQENETPAAEDQQDFFSEEPDAFVPDEGEIPEDAILIEGEDGSDELYLVEITEDENEALEEPEDEAEAELEEEIPDFQAEEETPGLPSDDAETEEPEEDEELFVEGSEEPLPSEQETVDAAAASSTVFDSGSCGTNARWELLENSDYTWTLSITGSGAMTDYSLRSTSSGGGYTSNAPWIDYYFTKIVIGKDITSIGRAAFTGNTYIQSLSFKGTNVTSIGYASFYNCSGLSSVSLPANLKTIDEFAFDNCTSLAKITVPASVTTLGRRSLYSCSDVYYPKTAADWRTIGGNDAVSSSTKVHYQTSLAKAKVKISKSSYTYAAKAIKPSVKVTLGSKTLKKGTDYSVSYKNNKKCGTATITVSGINLYKGSVKKTFKIVKRSIAKAKVSGVKSKPYTGKGVKLSLKVKVKIGSKYVTLKKGRDYTVKYSNNKKVSTKKSKAKVTITGKGNYKGKIKRSFKVVKANPKLSFKSKKVSKTAKSSFTVKARKGVSAKLTLSYKSSNKSVATVNKKTGKVTPKKVGTAKITVTSKATKNYKAGKASYTVTIKPYKFTSLNYYFGNYSSYYIPLSTFRIFFGSVEAQSYYNYYSDAGKSGVCYGMSASSVLFNAAGSKLSKSNFRSSASRIYDLSLYDTYKSSGVTLKDTIEAMFVSQVGSAAQKVKNKHMNDKKGLVKQVRTGKPVMVLIWSGGGSGHAVVAYKAKTSGSTVKLYVYDCNHPDDSSRYITLYKSGSSYTGWYYDLGGESWSSSSGGRISYVTTAEYKKIWKNRKGSSSLAKMIISSDNFEIRNAEGELVASMVNGEFSSSREDIQMMLFAGEQPDAHLIYVPVGVYSVTNTSPSEPGLDMTALNVEQSIQISTESDTVLVDVNDEAGVNKASFEAGKGEVYDVTLMSELPSAEGKEEVSFSGVGTGSEITLGMEDGACVIDNAKDVSLEVNGEDVAYVVFDGEAVLED